MIGFNHFGADLPTRDTAENCFPVRRAPTSSLNLQPGEIVRVKSYEEILRTLDHENMNRGMRFDGEEVPFCGRTYRVRNRVEKFIDERTGKLRTMKTPAVILEGVYCQGRYSSHRMFCPRGILSWWREVWLDRVHEGASQMSYEKEPDHASMQLQYHPCRHEERAVDPLATEI